MLTVAHIMFFFSAKVLDIFTMPGIAFMLDKGLVNEDQADINKT